MVFSPGGKWIGDGDSRLVEYLCRKVALEESIDTLDNRNISEESKANINLNLCLKVLSEGDESQGY